MFSTIVAAIVFVLTTFILLFWVYDEFIRQKSSLELALIAHGKLTINWLNVWIVIGVWIGSGVYLWG
jgi:CDP-diglyceride synthetase